MTRLTTGVLAGIVCLATGVAAAQAQTVDDVVARYHESKGGFEKWKAIQTQRMTGILSTNGIELSAVLYAKRPNLGRQELVFDAGQGPITIVNIFDGSRGWSLNPMTGSSAPQEVVGREAETMKEQSDFDGALFDYKARGHSVELIGTEVIGDRKAHHVKVAREAQPAMHYYLDAETGAELRVAIEDEMAPVVELDDHRAVDGILLPHYVRVLQSGQVQAEISLSSIELNVPIADAMFTP